MENINTVSIVYIDILLLWFCVVKFINMKPLSPLKSEKQKSHKKTIQPESHDYKLGVKFYQRSVCAHTIFTADTFFFLLLL